MFTRLSVGRIIGQSSGRLNALANSGMQLITRSPNLLMQMGARAHATVVERFEQDTQIDLLESFYEEAITLNGASVPVKSKRMAHLAPQFAEGLPAK